MMYRFLSCVFLEYVFNLSLRLRPCCKWPIHHGVKRGSHSMSCLIGYSQRCLQNRRNSQKLSGFIMLYHHFSTSSPYFHIFCPFNWNPLVQLPSEPSGVHHPRRQTLPNKQISCDFRCGAPQRVQLSSKEQLVKTQLHLAFEMWEIFSWKWQNTRNDEI